MKNRGISLIILIVTIIVIIILAAVVILTLSKNNPIESAKEARFKEDVRTVQDQVSMYIASRYQKELSSFDKNTLNISGETLVSDFGMPVKYTDKIKVENGKIVYIGKNEKEKEWINSLNLDKGKLPVEWEKYIADITIDGVPIPKGFSFLEGTKETGTVIQDSFGNEFVWIPTNGTTYAKDFSFFSNYNATELNTVDDILPPGIHRETEDVEKYGGFYIGRYEATVEDETSNGNPTCKKGNLVWTNISYSDVKIKAENMYNNSNLSVQSGLLTGSAWDTTCNWIKEVVNSLQDSRMYGNCKNSKSPADVTGAGSKQKSGFSDKWSVKNIYDLAGNVLEYTSEKNTKNENYYILRGGSSNDEGDVMPVIYRFDGASYPGTAGSYRGFRIRLYIKTE